MLVVDASVAVKWFIQQLGCEAADALLADWFGEILVPDLFVIEVVAALVRQANFDKANRSASETAIDRFRQMIDEGVIVSERSTAEAIERAAVIALALSHSLKDCVYLELARERGLGFATCDAKFARKAALTYDRISLVA